jgi:hypothetical protein
MALIKSEQVGGQLVQRDHDRLIKRDDQSAGLDSLTG